jgi:hypothetical protein
VTEEIAPALLSSTADVVEMVLGAHGGVQRKACRGRRRKKERRGRRAAQGVQRPSQKEGAAREACSARRAEAVAERRSGAGGVQR